MISAEAVKLLEAGFLPIPSFQKRPAFPHKPLEGGAPRWRRDMVLNYLPQFDKVRGRRPPENPPLTRGAAGWGLGRVVR